MPVDAHPNRCVAKNDSQRVEMLKKAMLQLKADHPDTEITWPADGLTRYQTIEDWVDYHLSLLEA